MRCTMAIKSVSIRIEEEMLDKLAYIADYEGRSVNSQVLVLIRSSIAAFEREHGERQALQKVTPPPYSGGFFAAKILCTHFKYKSHISFLQCFTIGIAQRK